MYKFVIIVMVAIGLELVAVVLLCTVAGSLCTSPRQVDDENELLAELDLLLPTSGDNIQVILYDIYDKNR